MHHEAPDYEPAMTNLLTLLDQLKAAQRTLILEAAKQGMMPPDNMLRRISDLENTIAAVEALVEEERAQRRTA